MTKKKYKVTFSVFNLLQDTQAEVVKLQNMVKGFMAVLTGATWYSSNSNNAMFCAIFAMILDTIISMFYFELQPNENNKSDNNNNAI